jgi:hypothetical protein
MLPSAFALFPQLAIAACVLFVITSLVRGAEKPGYWQFPAILSLLFAGWTAFTVWSEGPLGFWSEHVRNAWTNQIWFDLLLAFSMTWIMLMQRARKLRMKLWFWLLFFLCSGSVGLLAMFARCLYLEQHLKEGAYRA